MWRHTSEHITIKEGRALVLALRRLARSSKHRSRNHAFLLDNLALCFAVHKGRAHTYDMLRIMQQVGSICLAASLGVFPRWIPSEWNVADGPSRGQVSPGPFKKEPAESATPPTSSRVVAMRAPESAFQRLEVRTLKGSCPPEPAKEKAAKRVMAHGGPVMPTVKRARRSVQAVSVPHSGEVGTLARKQELTKLEARSVSVECRAQYGLYLDKFKGFCTANGIALAAAGSPALADFMDLLEDGKAAHVGEKTVAALEFYFLQFKNQLPRARRALRGWRKARPATSRLALPRLAMYGIAMQMVADGQQLMGLMVMVTFFLYLRPGEAHDLLGRHVIPPVKAGSQFAWVNVVIRGNTAAGCQEKAKKSGQPDFSNFRTHFVSAGKQLGLDGLHPYQLRHGGCHRRSLRQTQRLPRCEAARSMAHRPECSALRQDGSRPAVAQQVGPQQHEIPHVGREKHAKGVHGCGATSTALRALELTNVFEVKQKPHFFALEIFGSRVTQAFLQRCMSMYPIDACLSPSHNVLSISVEKKILAWMQQGRVSFIWVRMPSATYSLGCKSVGQVSKPLRSLQCLWGLQTLTLTAKRASQSHSKQFVTGFFVAGTTCL